MKSMQHMPSSSVLRSIRFDIGFEVVGNSAFDTFDTFECVFNRPLGLT